MIWKHSNNDYSIISSEISLEALATKRSVLSMDSFGRLLAVSLCKNHGYSPLSTTSSSLITRGTLLVRELRSICKELELNWSFLLRILFSHFQSRELQRCHKQAGRYISPGRQVADTKLQILVRFSSNFVAFFMLCSLVVHPKRKDLS